MGIIGRLLGDKGQRDAPPDGEIDRMVERVVALSPRLRLARGYDVRLRSAIAKAAGHLRELVATFPPPRPLGPASWATDPYIRAFFGAADEIGPALARSTELCAFLEHEPGLGEAFAVLGMRMSERRTLGVAREGDAVRVDVPQTTLSFSEHHLRICGPSDAELRREIVHRMIDQLAIEALSRIAADSNHRDVLEQERALLAARLRLLERQGTGMRSVLGSDEQADAGELLRLRSRLEENDNELKTLGTRSAALDRQLDGMCEAFANAAQLIHVEDRRLRLSRMNVLLAQQQADGAGADEGHTFDLRVARVPGDPPRERVFALVTLARADVPKARNMLDEADRLL